MNACTNMYNYTYIVDSGDYSRFRLYTGNNLFFAGLAVARGHRDKAHTAFGDFVQYYNTKHMCEDNGCNDEEEEFLNQCLDIGNKFKRRRPYHMHQSDFALKLSPSSQIFNEKGYLL